jgi:hypothetical protein
VVVRRKLEVLMSFMRETRELQDKYLASIREENRVSMEKAAEENRRLIASVGQGIQAQITLLNGSLAEFKRSVEDRTARLEDRFNKILLTLIGGFGAMVLAQVAPKLFGH